MYDGSFRVSVPASRKKGADIYLNESLLKLVRSNNFEKVGDQMTSYVEENDLEKDEPALQPEAEIKVTDMEVPIPIIDEDTVQEASKAELPDHSQRTITPDIIEDKECEVLYDFEPQEDCEISIKKGEIVTLKGKYDDRWYEGVNSAGEQGYFPITYVQLNWESKRIHTG